MIELLVAMGVMFSALLVLAYTMLTGLSAVGFSRQRTEATALANQALEEIRALPANQLYMSSSDISADSQLVSCGTNTTCFNGRTVPVATNSSANAPLFPHITHTTGAPGNTPYTIESYLTYDPSDTTNHTLIATVQVSWTGSQIGGVANHVQVETKIYNNQFNEAPPTVHTFMAQATGIPGTITVTGTLLGNQLVDLNMPLPSTTAYLNGTSIPGTTNVGTSGGTVTSGIGLPAGFNGIKAAGVSILSTPSVTANASSAAGASQGGPTTQSATGTVASAIPGALGIDTGTISSTLNVGPAFSASAVAASNANGGVSTPGQGNLPTNGLGYGQSEASQTGAAGATLSVAGLSLLGLSIPLASIGLVNIVPTGASAPDSSVVAQNGTASLPLKQTYTATTTQQFTELDVLGIGLLGAAPVPLIALTGFNKTATACAGPGTCTATTSSAENGAISILGGAPIQLQTILSDSQPALQLVNNLLTGINLPLGVLGSVGVSGVGISTAGSTPVLNGPNSISVGSPLTINLTAQATVLGVSLLNVNINITLGTASASASYS